MADKKRTVVERPLRAETKLRSGGSRTEEPSKAPKEKKEGGKK